ncbi:hypothetical protein DVB87_20185 [Tsukamurella tyrosinosolvens]|nr:hypothetical protein DVB87_20185 [Tsukamurella tyrosinosolvens]
MGRAAPREGRGAATCRPVRTRRLPPRSWRRRPCPRRRHRLRRRPRSPRWSRARSRPRTPADRGPRGSPRGQRSGSPSKSSPS